jgi:hypothetical protein
VEEKGHVGILPWSWNAVGRGRIGSGGGVWIDETGVREEKRSIRSVWIGERSKVEVWIL